jgi:uncharacterized protein involved in exopolysaccharide biosynthesis
MQPDVRKILVLELGDALVKSWWTVVAGLCLGLAAGLLALHVIPKQYQAGTRILVAPQQIPQNFVRATVTEDITRRMMILEEAKLTERYKRELIERTFGLPETEEEFWELVGSVQSRVVVAPEFTEDLHLLAFELTYRDADADRAAAVANTITELYIEQHSRLRSSRAKDTTRAIEKRAEDAQKAFEAADKKLSEFAAKHAFETEAQLDSNMLFLDTRQRDLNDNLDQQDRTTEQLTEVEEDLAQLEATMAEPLEEQIREAQSKLKDLLARYSEAHPDVARQRRMLDDLLAAAARSESEEREVSPSASAEVLRSEEYIALDDEAQELRHELAALKGDEENLRKEIAKYERRIQAVSRIQPQLTNLTAERDRLWQNYRELEREAGQARDSQFVEESLRGERFEVARWAGVPDKPVAPKPIPVAGLAVIAGCMLFVGPVLARRGLNPLVSSESGLRALSDVPVLVSLPRVITAENRREKSRRFAKNVGLSLVSAAVLVMVVFHVV